MMKQVMVEIEEDEVVVASLTDTLEYVEVCIFNHENPKKVADASFTTPLIFSNDPEEDLKKLEKFRKALKKVLRWYTP